MFLINSIQQNSLYPPAFYNVLTLIRTFHVLKIRKIHHKFKSRVLSLNSVINFNIDDSNKLKLAPPSFKIFVAISIIELLDIKPENFSNNSVILKSPYPFNQIYELLS